MRAPCSSVLRRRLWADTRVERAAVRVGGFPRLFHHLCHPRRGLRATTPIPLPPCKDLSSLKFWSAPLSWSVLDGCLWFLSRTQRLGFLVDLILFVVCVVFCALSCSFFLTRAAEHCLWLSGVFFGKMVAMGPVSGGLESCQRLMHDYGKSKVSVGGWKDLPNGAASKNPCKFEWSDDHCSNWGMHWVEGFYLPGSYRALSVMVLIIATILLFFFLFK